MKNKIELVMKPDRRPEERFYDHEFVLSLDLEMLIALARGGYDFDKNTLGVSSGRYGNAGEIVKEYLDKKFPIEAKAEEA